jgi:hypothetical protein
LEDDSELSITGPSQLIPKLLLTPLKSLKSYPPKSVVLVIDALDECGDEFTRHSVLADLFKASSHATWLKIIITSRPEEEIQSFFLLQEPSGSFMIHDLVQIQASLDIRHFLRVKMGSIVTRRGLRDWPEDAVLDTIIDRSGGLFIYADTVYQVQ